jgi:hypothetical protein
MTHNEIIRHIPQPVPSQGSHPCAGTAVAPGAAVRLPVLTYGILAALPLLGFPCTVRAQQIEAPPPQDVSCETPAPAPQSPPVNSRIFGVMPNFATADDAASLPPVSTQQKFHMAALYAIDPYVYPFVGAIAAVGRGEGDHGYLERYALAFTDNALGSMMTVGVVPTLFHQDPRYFRLGKGGAWRRARYGVSRSVVARSDAGRTMFNVSEIGGNLLTASVANLYYPSGDRSVGNTLTRWGMQVMWDTLSNELKEFWPDIRRKIRKTK